MTDRLAQIDAAVSLACARHTQPLTQAGKAMLRRHGITASAIFEARHHTPCLGWARIEGMAGGRFVFADEGEEALIMLVHERGYALDLIAIPAFEPETWLLRFGLGFALGADEMAKARMLGRPITMHRSPLQWLKRGGQGACLLLGLEDVPDALPALPEKMMVTAEDADFGAALQAACIVRGAEVRTARHV